jgi:hypothetical protein
MNSLKNILGPLGSVAAAIGVISTVAGSAMSVASCPELPHGLRALSGYIFVTVWSGTTWTVGSALCCSRSSPSRAKAPVCRRGWWVKARTSLFHGFNRPSCQLHMPAPCSFVSTLTFIMQIRHPLAPLPSRGFSAALFRVCSLTLAPQSRTGTKDLQNVDLKLRVLFRPMENQLPHIHTTYGFSHPSLPSLFPPTITSRFHCSTFPQARASSKASFLPSCRRRSSPSFRATTPSNCSP